MGDGGDGEGVGERGWDDGGGNDKGEMMKGENGR